MQPTTDHAPGTTHHVPLTRVALVTNVMAHYRVPCFRRLAEFLPGKVDYFFMSSRMEHRRYVLARSHDGLCASALKE